MPAWGPAHKDSELWAIVAFVEQLPAISAERYAEMTRGELQRHGPGEEAVGTMTNELNFKPERITVKAGTAVTWRNTSDVVHTVTADAALAKDKRHVMLPAGAKPFNSGDIKPGERFEYTFDVRGTCRYFCIPHEMAGMVGEVVVQ